MIVCSFGNGITSLYSPRRWEKNVHRANIFCFSARIVFADLIEILQGDKELGDLFIFVADDGGIYSMYVLRTQRLKSREN